MNNSIIDFNKNNGLVPCIVQDALTERVLMLGFMNEEAYMKTMSGKKVTFFSRTKNRLWTKGETSGNYLHVVDVIVDCDQDTLLVKATPDGPVCHNGTDTCFGETNGWSLQTLERVIQSKKEQPSARSYTSTLFQAGINKIAQKVGEEAVELIIEAKDTNDDLFLNEAADLLYHYMVLIQARGLRLKDVLNKLESRDKSKGV